MDSKEEIFNRFYDLLCSWFGGASKMYDRFYQLCSEAGRKREFTQFSRLNRMELMILIEALTPSKSLAIGTNKPLIVEKHPTGGLSIDKLLDQAEYQEET